MREHARPDGGDDAAFHGDVVGAAAWAEGHLPAPPSRVEVVADSPRGLVARFETPVGAFFFKADRCLPPAEALVLDRLRRSSPQRVAPLVAMERERGWSLTRDVGRPGLEGASTPAWLEVAEAFGRLQRDAGDEGWIALGCRDRRGMRLHAALEAMLDEVEASLDLEGDVVRTLRRLRPRIRAACQVLDDDPIPPLLVQQDLVPINIVLADGGPVFLDWSDTVVGHPFFGLDRLLDTCWADAPLKSAVIEAYLRAFADLGSAAQRTASFQQVLWLRVLYEDLRWFDELASVDVDSEHAARLRSDMALGLASMAAAHG